MFHPNEPSTQEESPKIAPPVTINWSYLKKIAIALGAIVGGAMLCGGLGFVFGGEITICGLPVASIERGTTSGAITSGFFGVFAGSGLVLYRISPTFRALIETIARITGQYEE